MSDTSNSTPNGSTNISDEEKKRTNDLPDGSPTGDATTDPEQESDTTSGGEPE